MKTTTLKEKMMNVIKIIGTTLLSISVVACASNTISDQNSKPDFIPKWDIAPQVIYRIDDHRFISLENYDHCFGDTYFNNTKENIRTQLGRGGIELFRGRLVIDDPTEKNLVFASAFPGGCGSRGCDAALIYSTDGGRTFKSMYYMNHPDPEKASENYSILVAKDGFYVAEKRSQTTDSTYVIKYPLVPNIDLDNPYPEGVKGEGFALSKKSLLPLRTPSGQDRFTCDASIRPSNLPKEK
ncbi:hypothetical protein [Herbaspirillum sp. RV1423]|uniref:T6SS immunity protein Tli3 family protein n=1 Tax=Herbaspirillum sp. RV1423 TaxID=1443993 RepID=UPI000552C6FD|nr:hypothetical protein [Herbaspirillum sp. RV1423]